MKVRAKREAHRVSSHGNARDPRNHLGGTLTTLASKYIWWKNAGDPSLTPQRLLAQIMDIGDFANVQRVTEKSATMHCAM